MSIQTIAVSGNTGATNTRELIDNAASSLLSPKAAEGIKGWVFDIPIRESLDLSADITDHFVESGSFISDHIVIKPVRIALTGLIGELVFEGGGVAGVVSELNGVINIGDNSINFGKNYPSLIGVDFTGRNYDYSQGLSFGEYVERQLHEVR